MGKPQDQRAWPRAVRLGRRTWTAEQELGQQLRGVERELRRWHYMGLLRCIQADFRLECGRGSRDILGPSLYVHGSGRHTWTWNGDCGRWSRPAEKRTLTPITKMKGKKGERRSTPGDRYSDDLELGGLDDDDRNGPERGGREPSPSHDCNLRRIHAASHAGHGAKQSSPLVESRHRGIESETRPGPKTVPATTRRGRGLPALPSVSCATALVIKRDQDREEPCLVRTSQTNRVD